MVGFCVVGEVEVKAWSTTMHYDAVPTDAIFATHGLSNISLDLPGALRGLPSPHFSLDRDTSSSWRTDIGYGGLEGVDKHPLLVKADTASHDVRFSFCPRGDPATISRFRRRAQILVLDTRQCQNQHTDQCREQCP